MIDEINKVLTATVVSDDDVVHEFKRLATAGERANLSIELTNGKVEFLLKTTKKLGKKPTKMLSFPR